MLKVWIAGAEGQIGTAINEILDPLEMETFNTDRAELDITNTDEVLSFGEINRPDVIINCAAITDIALCELLGDGEVTVTLSLETAEAR